MGAVHLGAAAVFVVGVVQAAQYSMLMRFDGYEDMKRMINVDEGTGDSELGSIGMTVNLCFAAAVLCIFIGALGCLGNHCESKGPLCCYFLTTVALASFYFGIALYSYTVGTSIVPLAERQIAEFCNTSLNFAYETRMGCNDESNGQNFEEGVKAFAEKLLAKCGQECEERVQLLRRMGGCAHLMRLCHKYDYGIVGEGYCLVATPNGSEYLPPTIPSSKDSSVSTDCCLEACDASVGCSGFTYQPSTKRCFLLAPSRPLVAVSKSCDGVQWDRNVSTDLMLFRGERPRIVGAAGGDGLVCHEKTEPVLLGSIVATIGTLGFMSAVASLVLVGATMCACCLQYTLSTRRKGKKGPSALMARMLCPCCEPRTSVADKNSSTKLEILAYYSDDERSDSE